MGMSHEEASAWLHRWTLVAAREDEALRAMSIATKLAQLESLRDAARDLGFISAEDDLPRVRELWCRLRAARA